MNVSDLKTMFGYHYWANSQVWDCVLKLTDEQFTRDLPYSVGSIQRHLAHMMVVEWFWFSVVADRLPADRSQHLRVSEFPTREAIGTRWEALQAEVFAYLDTAGEAQVNRILEYEFSWCGKQRQPAWVLLIYTITHATDHRAQILQGIHHMGGETVPQDFVRYLWEHP
ncbi:MAG: DinB family protein [Anaerolineae bacterium]